MYLAILKKNIKIKKVWRTGTGRTGTNRSVRAQLPPHPSSVKPFFVLFEGQKRYSTVQNRKKDERTRATDGNKLPVNSVQCCVSSTVLLTRLGY